MENDGGQTKVDCNLFVFCRAAEDGDRKVEFR